MGEGMGPYHATAELKQTAQAKILALQISIRKQSHQIVKLIYH